MAKLQRAVIDRAYGETLLASGLSTKTLRYYASGVAENGQTACRLPLFGRQLLRSDKA
jgi:hypothetical protein